MFHRISRVFTHPYGACRIDDCDEPSERFMDSLCHNHWVESLRRIAKEEADRKFEYDVSVVEEGIRRASLTKQ